MEFKRARTSAQIEKRRQEIIDVSAALFDLGGPEAVHFKAIGEQTTFGRSTIYKYYTIKEEILLDLLLLDVMNFGYDIRDLTSQYQSLSREDFCRVFTQAYMKSDRLLKLMSILYSSLEKNSSLEKLTDFKRNLIGFMEPIYAFIEKFFPQASPEEIQTFIATSSAFVLGLYPSTHATDKQKEAMRLSGYDYEMGEFEDLCYRGLLLLSSDLSSV